MAAAKPVVVGGFVLGGIALGVVAILVFGGIRLFSRSVRIVVVFAGSVAGLEVGSPVTFRGVPIGRVEAMRVQVDLSKGTNSVPVFLDLEPKRISWQRGSPTGGVDDIQNAVESGLRAQLVSQSFITGQLSVNLEFQPGTRPVPRRNVDGVLEVPTIPSNLENLEKDFREFNLPDLGVKMRQTLFDLQRVIDTLQARIDPMAADLHETLVASTAAVRAIQSDAHRTLGQIDQLAVTGREQVEIDGKDFDHLLRNADHTVEEADKLLLTLNELTAPDSALRDDLQGSLRDLAASASSLRTFTHDLEHNPVGTLLSRHPE
jgi:paraquat-inducible protein B